MFMEMKFVSQKLSELPLQACQCLHLMRPVRRDLIPVKIVRNLGSPIMAYVQVIRGSNLVPGCKMDPKNAEYIECNEKREMQVRKGNPLERDIRQQVAIGNRFFALEKC